MCDITSGQEYNAKEAENEINVSVYVYRQTNAERETYDYTGDKWSHWNSNKRSGNMQHIHYKGQL